MKINIQIEDASLEDLQKLFSQAPGITFVPARPKISDTFTRMGADTSAGPILKLPVANVLVKKPSGVQTDSSDGVHKTVPDIKSPKADAPKVEKTVPISVLEKPKSDTKVKPAPKKARGNKSNKFGIPISLYKTDHKAYSTAWAYCNAHGITYDKIGEFKAAKKAERAKPKKPVKPSTQRVHDAVKNAPPATVIHDKINTAIIKQNGPLHLGQQVKHNGLKSSPFFGKVGEILKISDDGQLFVKFGSSSTWLPQSSIFVVKEVTV
jgi:hypothetical protein